MRMKLEDVKDSDFEEPMKAQSEEPSMDSQTDKTTGAESFLSIWEVVLPLLHLMRVTGKYLGTAKKIVAPLKESDAVPKAPVCGIVWCTSMTMLYFISTLRMIAVLATCGKQFKDAIPESITFLMFLLNFVEGVWLIFKNRQIPSLLENIDIYHRRLGSEYQKPLVKVKRLVRIMVYFGTMGGGTAAFIIYFMGSSNLGWFIYPFEDSTGTTRLLVQIASALFSTLFSFGMMGNNALFAPLSMVLCEDFKIFNDDVKVSLSKKASTLSAEEVERFRRRWEELCSLVEQTDDIYKSYALTSYLFAFVTICLIAFGLAYNGIEATSLFFVLGICIFCIMDIVAVTLFSVRLHMKAHESKESLLMVKLDKLSEKTVQIINVFLGRLTGPSIGFSVCGFFTIDVGAILTLVSTLVAYVIVVLQFQSGETTCVFTLPNSTSPSNWTMTTAAV